MSGVPNNPLVSDEADRRAFRGNHSDEVTVEWVLANARRAMPAEGGREAIHQDHKGEGLCDD